VVRTSALSSFHLIRRRIPRPSASPSAPDVVSGSMRGSDGGSLCAPESDPPIVIVHAGHEVQPVRALCKRHMFALTARRDGVVDPMTHL